MFGNIVAFEGCRAENELNGYIVDPNMNPTSDPERQCWCGGVAVWRCGGVVV